MAKTDYYKLLGVENTATDSEIKKAYRKKAIEFHPDKNPDDKEAEDKFKEVSEAYEILSNKEKRENYDRFGHSSNSNFNGGPSMDDLFRQFREQFGGQQTRVMKGDNVTIQINLTLEEMFTGIHENLNYNISKECAPCNGYGGSGEICKSCSGKGSKVKNVNFGNRQILTSYECDNCDGTGFKIETKCDICKGRGETLETIDIKIEIPKGVTHGNRIIHEGRGNQILKGQNGDLEVLIIQKHHDFFIRSGDNLLCETELDYYDFILGCDKEVLTIEGSKIKLKIPKLTKINSQLRASGKGMPSLNNGVRGSMIITLKLKDFNEVSDNEINLLESIKKINQEVVTSSNNE